MKMKRHYLLVIVTVLWVVTTAFPLLAGDHCCKSGSKCCGDRGSGCCDLSNCIPDLKPEQKAKIKELCKACEKKVISLNAELKKKKLDLEELAAGSPDKEKVDAGLDEIYRLKAQIKKACVGCYLSIRDMLTDKQKEHLDKCRQCAGGECCQHQGRGKCCAGGHGHGKGKCCAGQHGAHGGGKCCH